eukprot:scaffold211111_cov17-Prasinocladus_malaysianus.AAC.1
MELNSQQPGHMSCQMMWSLCRILKECSIASFAVQLVRFPFLLAVGPLICLCVGTVCQQLEVVLDDKKEKAQWKRGKEDQPDWKLAYHKGVDGCGNSITTSAPPKGAVFSCSCESNARD